MVKNSSLQVLIHLEMISLLNLSLSQKSLFTFEEKASNRPADPQYLLLIVCM